MKLYPLLFVSLFYQCAHSPKLSFTIINDRYIYRIGGNICHNSIIDYNNISGESNQDWGVYNIKYNNRFIAYYSLVDTLYCLGFEDMFCCNNDTLYLYQGDTIPSSEKSNTYDPKKIKYFIIDTRLNQKIEYCSQHSFDSVVNKLELVPFEHEVIYE